MSENHVINGPLNYNAYRHFLITFNEWSKDDIVLDLREIRGIYPSGVATFGSLLYELKNSGRQIQVIYPTSPQLHSYLDKTGFISVVENGTSIAPPKTSGRLPLTKYTNGDELNQVIDSALSTVASSGELPKGVLDTLEWTLNELADNVLVHSGANPIGWIQLVHTLSRNELEFAIVDRGRGVLETLKEGFPQLNSDSEALELAVQKGITRDRSIGQGNGLAGTLKLATASRGFLNIHSGRGSIRQSPNQQLHSEYCSYHQGTICSLTIPISSEIDVTTALWGRSVVPALESKYVDDEGIRFILRQESTGFGNRSTGRALRTKLSNLMNQFPDSVVTIDFRDVDIISASFADEFLAKNVKEMGFIKFSQIIRLTNLSRFAQTTIDNVIQQRLSVIEVDEAKLDYSDFEQ